MDLWHSYPACLLALGLAVGCTGRSIMEKRVVVTGRFGVTRGLFGSAVTALAVGHCDDDATLDVFVFGPDHSGVVPDGQTPMVIPQMYLGRGDGTFAPVSVPSLPTQEVGAASFDDVDGDGHEDIIVSQGYVELYRNLGNCQFAPPVQIAVGRDHPALSIQPTDIDLDGITDLAVAVDGPTQQPYRILIGQGNGLFVETQVPVTPLDTGASLLPFSAFFDDADGDGVRDLFALNDRSEAWFSWGNRTTGTFARDDSASSEFSSACPMSIAPLDYNNDGTMDYFVSGVPGNSLLLQGGSRSLANQGEYAYISGTDGTQAWGAWAFDADLDGTQDILLQRYTDDNGSPTPGPTELYLNNGDGTFDEEGQNLIGTVLYAKTLLCGDLSGDANRGCFVLSTEGPILLTDRIVPRGHWAGLHLRGTVSAPDATGARVTLSGTSRTYYYGPQDPYAGTHDASLDIAIGQNTTAAVDIHWPSGIVQHVSGLAAGTYTTVVEPAGVTLSARTAPADGATTVSVAVNPAAMGATQASVSLTGAGTLAAHGPTQWTVTAPNTAGEAVLTITLDGVPLVVRPRVRFGGPMPG